MDILGIIDERIKQGKTLVANMLENRRQGAFKDAWKKGIEDYGIRVGRGEKMVYNHMFKILDGEMKNDAFPELVEKYLETEIGEDVQDLAKWYFDHDKFFSHSVDFTGLLKMTRRGLHIYIRTYLNKHYSVLIPIDEVVGGAKMRKLFQHGLLTR